jgi:hypothetical protein
VNLIADMEDAEGTFVGAKPSGLLRQGRHPLHREERPGMTAAEVAARAKATIHAYDMSMQGLN